MRTRGGRDAFSLTEMLVVVAVILILVSLMFVAGERIYARSLQVKCQQHLEQIGNGLRMYASSTQGAWPGVWCPSTGRSWFETLALEYVEDPTVLGCPVVGRPPVTTSAGVADQDVRREKASEFLKALRWLKNEHIPEKGAWEKGWLGSLDRWGQSVTGLALLAFFAFGCNDSQPAEFAETVRLTVEYLSSSQAQYRTGSNAGKFKQSNEKIYNQGICVMALAAAAQNIQDPSLRAKAASAAQLGVNWMVQAQDQSDYGAFTYEVPFDQSTHRHIDTNATCWFYHGIAAAKDAGLSVPSSVYDKAGPFLKWSCAWAGDGGAFYWISSDRIPHNGHGGTSAITTPVRLATGVVMGYGIEDTYTKKLADCCYSEDRPTAKLLSMERKSPQESHTYATYFMNEAMVRLGGKYEKKWRADYFPHRLIAIMDNGGVDDAGHPMAYWSNYDCHDIGGSWSGRGIMGDTYATAMACNALGAGYTDHWLLVEGTPPTAEASYGYNNQVGLDRGRPAADTIVVMDYHSWEIDHDENDPDKNDSPTDIATRHSDRANALMGDGSVRAFYVEDIREGMWTPEPGD